MNSIQTNMTYLALYSITLLLLSACQGPTDEEEPYFDKDIPSSEEVEASNGVWSPDGTKIAFQYDAPLGDEPDPGKLDQLWIYDIETGERWKILDGRVGKVDWGPNNGWFLFNTRLGASESGYLYKVKINGNEISKLTGSGSPNDLVYTVLGKWSPQGSKILFTVVAGEPRGISIMDPDGTDAKIIIPYGVAASWFPDGNKIVYANWDTTITDPNQRRQLYTANRDGSNIQKITNLPNSTHLSSPVVSPDGEKIAFVHRGRDRSLEVFMMNADGTGIEQLTEGEGIAQRPEWHPDGQTILFTRFIPNVSERMYLLDVQTRQVEPVFPAE